MHEQHHAAATLDLAHRAVAIGVPEDVVGGGPAAAAVETRREKIFDAFDDIVVLGAGARPRLIDRRSVAAHLRA